MSFGSEPRELSVNLERLRVSGLVEFEVTGNKNLSFRNPANDTKSRCKLRSRRCSYFN